MQSEGNGSPGPDGAAAGESGPDEAAAGGRARIIVVGNEKGGSGKSTTAMHLIVGLMRRGRRVASIDLDVRQGTLSRYLENRRAWVEAHNLTLPMPRHRAFRPEGDLGAAVKSFSDLVASLRVETDDIVVDTPGSNSPMARLGHAWADILVTPLNDSLIDLDVLARIDAATLRIDRPGSYAEMVWEQKKQRAKRQRRAIDWLVMRNRLSNLDAHNKRLMERLLRELAGRIGFRVVPGFGERVIYRELFPRGLTMLDLREAWAGAGLTMSQVVARQEVRALVEALGT